MGAESDDNRLPQETNYVRPQREFLPQIAEGWYSELLETQIEAMSAGVEAHGLDQHAVSVMADKGVDISRQRSKTIDTFDNVRIDLIVTLSD